MPDWPAWEVKEVKRKCHLGKSIDIHLLCEGLDGEITFFLFSLNTFNPRLSALCLLTKGCVVIHLRDDPHSALTMAYVAAVLFAAPPLRCPVPKVSLSLLMLTVLNSSSSSFFSACRADICSLDGCQPHQSLHFPPLVKCFVETLHFTDTHTISCPWCELNNKSKLFKCQNSCHPLSQLQHSPGWSPSRPLSNVHNSCRRLQPFSHTSVQKTPILPCLQGLWLLMFNSTPQLTDIEEVQWPWWPDSTQFHQTFKPVF